MSGARAVQGQTLRAVGAPAPNDAGPAAVRSTALAARGGHGMTWWPPPEGAGSTQHEGAESPDAVNASPWLPPPAGEGPSEPRRVPASTERPPTRSRASAVRNR